MFHPSKSEGEKCKFIVTTTHHLGWGFNPLFDSVSLFSYFVSLTCIGSGAQHNESPTSSWVYGPRGASDTVVQQELECGSNRATLVYCANHDHSSIIHCTESRPLKRDHSSNEMIWTGYPSNQDPTLLFIGPQEGKESSVHHKGAYDSCLMW